MMTLKTVAAVALLATPALARILPASATLSAAPLNAVPTTCTDFVITGFTYNIYTACDTVKGLPVLRLLDEQGTEVAYNDGFPFCGGNTTAALIEFKMECYEYPTPVAEFALSSECVLDTACSGDLVVEVSTKVPSDDCGRYSPPPPQPGFDCAKQDADCEALGLLYYSTGGPDWKSSGGWSTAAIGKPTDYCSFFTKCKGKASCDKSGSLQCLALEGNDLTGTFPAADGPITFGTFAHLTYLQLDSNGLEGTIPAYLNLFTALNTLILTHNFLNGPIPDLSALSALTFLRLGTNELSGTLPASIGSLTALQALFLDHLLLNGTVPSSFANLKALTTLQMASSGLCGTVPGHQPNDGPLPAC